MHKDINKTETTLFRFMQKCRWFSAITAAVTTFFFLSTFYLVPCAHAMDVAVKNDQAKHQYHPKGGSDEEKLSNTLQDIKEHVAERKARVKQRVENESGLWQDFLNLFGLSRLIAEDLDDLASMAEQTGQLNEKALQGVSRIEQDLIDKGVPEEILQRHYDTVDQYQDQYERFLEKLE